MPIILASLTALIFTVPQVTNAEIITAEVSFSRGRPAHIVAAPKTPLEQRMLDRLSAYLEKVLGVPPVVVPQIRRVPRNQPAIVLINDAVASPWPMSIPDNDDEGFILRTGMHQNRPLVVAAGRTDRGLKRAIQQLVFHSRQEPGALVIPALDLSLSPWIAAREWIACPWTPHFIRGVFYNPQADSRMDIFRYNNQRLSDYVEMFDWLGFSGCQLMETCYTYAVFGSVEDAQDWQKRVAGYLRDNGQEVSLWAWSAQFNGHGWVDPDVTYTPAAGASAFDDPAVRRSFEKYYDHYANLAPYIDRFFAHFYDPGELKNRQDVFNYMRLLESKLKARNPKVLMGIDGWSAEKDYLIQLADQGFKDYLLLEIIFPELYPRDARKQLHERARDLGLQLGMWGWYATEYETDQMASMYVNAQLLRDIYQKVKTEAFPVQPIQYWSEMEANHLNNIYSMYAASQLLWDPDRDPRELLAEITDAIWGPRNGPVVLEALELIQDMRSGPTWATYWWTKKTHRVGSEDPVEDLKRVEKIIIALDGMEPDQRYVPKLPLPYSPETFFELMRPHLLQIRDYARFRAGIGELQAAASAGTATDILQRKLDEVWQPVPEYNTWIGVFGNKELREQKKIVRQIAKDYGLQVNDPSWLRELEAGRVLQQLQTWQKTSREPYLFDSIQPTREFFWPDDNRNDRFNLLVERGLVVPEGEGKFRLADWENWRLRP